jgi:trehalose synthase
MWKKKPVIASPVGGIGLQLRDGEFGYFYHDAIDSAEKIVYLLTHPQAAEFMGRQGKNYIRDHFLMPDRITDHLKTIQMMMESDLDPESIVSFHSWHKLDRRR